ncbi:thiamine pyrophosphate-binding protein [Pseudosporangium ferrugineum]|uniref:thiamine pyrophosphate-binding protein n=1 Tax=Pseudosporangium ferrugineum TaxID=439699 RepID=UPI001FE6ACE8|nr:thiamine pyrophosphate-binding protein [Pseudosporangium ferrugineum]
MRHGEANGVRRPGGAPDGLYDAKLDSQPVVAIVGQQTSTVLGSAYQQEIDLVRLFGDVCAQFVQAAHTSEQVPMLIDKAFRTALATRGPTCVVLPHDVQSAAPPDPAAKEHGVLVTSPGLRPAHVLPHDDDVRAAAGAAHGEDPADVRRSCRRGHRRRPARGGVPAAGARRRGLRRRAYATAAVKAAVRTRPATWKSKNMR